MLIFRALPFLAAAILICVVVYYAGKHMRLWPGFSGGSKPVAAKPQQPVVIAPARPAHEGLMEDIRHELLLKQRDTWLHAVRSERMLRVYSVTEDGIETVYIDTIGSEDFINRIQHERVSVRVWSCAPKDASVRMQVRTVLATVIKPDTADEHSEYDIERGSSVTEGTPTQLATDDELRKLKIVLRQADVF